MATWKQINEIGGTVILRVVVGAFATLMAYGLVKVAWARHLTIWNGAILLAGIALFGGYAVFGTRLKVRGR